MKRTLFFLALFALPVFAHKVVTPQQHREALNPWFTGPLLAPCDVVVQARHYNIEPYVYLTATTGAYGSGGKVVKASQTFWQLSLQPALSFGLTEWMDIQIIPGIARNRIGHQHRVVFQDLDIIFDFQILKPRHIDDWTPFIKFFLSETFPTGKYRKLDPKKLGADVGGSGSYRTSTGFVLGKLFYISAPYFFNTRLFLQYQWPAPVRLLGLNAYGGNLDTNARFFPGQNFEADLGVELTLTRNWVLACDLAAQWTKKPHYSGNRGTTDLGTRALLGAPGFSSQYALAPAIEYNWSANLGLIGGCWFTFAGKNASRFWSAVVAFNYYR